MGDISVGPEISLPHNGGFDISSSGISSPDSAGLAKFSPLNIADLVLWLDAADLSTITESSGSVSQWDDKSGNGNNAAQATGAEQPATGGSINGVNAITWDITDDNLVVTQDTTINGLWGTGGTTVYVSQGDSLGGGGFGRFAEKGASSLLKRSGGIGLLQLDVPFTTQSADFRTPSNSFPAATTTPAILTITYDASNVSNEPTFFIDGTAVSTVVNNTPTGTYVSNTTNLTIGNTSGATSGFDGEFGEILYYKHALTTSELDVLHTYLLNKWGI